MNRVAGLLLVGGLITSAPGCTPIDRHAPPSSPPAELTPPRTGLPPAQISVVEPPPQARGDPVTVSGSIDWTGHSPGCVILSLGSGQRFQLTGTAADEGEHQARSGHRPSPQHAQVTGHLPPAGATSCGPLRAFWATDIDAPAG